MKPQQPNPKEQKKSKQIENPSITLPKGGGGIKSIDEKFSVNAVNGTSSFSIPLPVSTGRGFAPDLTVSYSSGGGNGIFGLGWNLGISSIKRKTEKELPQYNDAQDSDTYIFSEAEDLVPALIFDDVDDVWIKDERSTTDYLIRKYRPRTEGSFIRIERWTKKSDGIIHWRVIKADNTQVVFGKNAAARISDPNNDRLIFEWMIDYSFDDSGNFIQYHYKVEDLAGIDSQLVNERNRINENSKVANSYLKSIQYGNTTPYNPSGSVPTDFMFETILDYGECENTVPFDDAGYEWIYRADAFSEYRAGFEIRHARLCKRVILMHYFSQLNGGEAVVKTVDFNYFNNDQSGFTFLQNFIVTGYTKHDTGTYTEKALPPIEFEYQKHEWNTDVKNADPSALEHSPVGLGNASYQWIDLYSEGLTGILTEQGNGLYYKQNLGEGKFTPAKLISPKPSFGLSGGMQVMELDANGIKQMGSYSSEPAGYFEINDEEEWQSFHSIQSLPNINFQDPQLKFIDIDGDGLADLVITENDVLRWYKGKGSKGFSESRKVYRELDEEKGCRAVFADMTQSIFIADMNGDGLSDIVRIRHSEVSYWPNMGYGKFGAKVTMNQSPHFDSADHFNPAYLQLSDIDGSGTTDIIYLGNNQCQIYINHQGNGFGESPNIIFPFPSIDHQAVLSLVDYLANGTGCIVWSSSLQKDAHMPMKYIDLMNGKKPHILKKYKNNFGKEVEIEYKVSTKFYTEAKLAGKPWITKLPFPVHCVSKVITYDRIRKLRFASTYSYAHGYYDHIEREFRGFGRVDQYDAETIDHYILNSSSAIEAQDLHQHPVLTRTWFHTGAMVRHQKMLHQFEQEYYQNPSITEYDMPESTIPTGMAADEYVYAYRALKGTPLRKEVYAMDESADQDKPYLVEQQNVLLKLIQPKLNNKYPVLFSHAQESIVYTYERDMTDPRIAHSFVLEVNEIGAVTKSVNVVYPRLVSTTYAEQEKKHIVYTTVDYTNGFDTDDDFLHPMTCQTKTYEVSMSATPGDYYDLVSILDDCVNATVIDYEVTPSTSALNKRVIENVRVLYKDNDGTTPLAYEVLDTKGLLHETYYAAFNDNILDDAFGSKMSLSSLQTLVQDATKGGYVFDDGYYWIPSGTQVFDTAHFYLPTSYIDPFGNTTTVQYDTQYLFIDKTIDALSNTSMIVKFNYRTLAPVIMEDINENLAGVRYDELGMVISSFIIGKTTDLGDVMDQTTAEISSTDEPGIEMTYTTDNWYVQCNTSGFDIDDYMPNPNCVYTKARDIHALDPNAASTKWMESYSYSDGSGGVIMQKTKAEVGDAIIPNLGGAPTTVTNVPRWVGNGRTIVNNKGNAVKQYEPFFSTHYGFEDESEMVQMGVTPVLHYDALGRNIRTDMPDGTFTKVSFTAWDQTSYDQNDTVLDSQWYADRNSPNPDDPMPVNEIERTAWLSAQHYDTPSKSYFDTLGRVFNTEVNNGGSNIYNTIINMDIEGNPLSVIDANSRTASEVSYDIAGNALVQTTMDAGTRWSLYDATGKPIISWDDMNREYTFDYDALHRPTDFYLDDNGTGIKTIETREYGTNTALNLNGRLWRHRDQASEQITVSYDFKGNLLENTKQFIDDYGSVIDWSGSVTLMTDVYTTSAEFDALNKPIVIYTPQGGTTVASELYYTFNDANLLDKIEVKLPGGSLTTYIDNINYDAKGQRTEIFYGNNSKTSYFYNPMTYRIVNIYTTSGGGSTLLQDLQYYYDAVGNIVEVFDGAQPNTFYNSILAEPKNFYEYDALNRLVVATGRKHAGQGLLGSSSTNSYDQHPYIPLTPPGPNTVGAFEVYKEEYDYDSVNNLVEHRHIAATSPYTRTNTYTTGNQISSSTVGSSTSSFSYDAHGNMLSLEHLSAMDWGFGDKLRHADLGGGGDAYYTYDSSGQRARKVINRIGGTRTERFYMGGFEIYREFGVGNTLDLERETLHILDGDRKVASIDTKTVDTSTPSPPTNNSAPYTLIRYQYDNHLGSASLELDDGANIISYEEYYPFGTTSYSEVDANREVPKRRYRYTGKERDEESGLYYHGARYYIPWLMRWASCDPIGIKDGLNIYAYCGNNPVMLNDPSGRSGEVNGGEFKSVTIKGEKPDKCGSNNYAIQDNLKFIDNSQLINLPESKTEEPISLIEGSKIVAKGFIGGAVAGAVVVAGIALLPEAAATYAGYIFAVMAINSFKKITTGENLLGDSFSNRERLEEASGFSGAIVGAGSASKALDIGKIELGDFDFMPKAASPQKGNGITSAKKVTKNGNPNSNGKPIGTVKKFHSGEINTKVFKEGNALARVDDVTWHLPKGATTADIPKNDILGNQIQAEISNIAKGFKESDLSNKQIDAINTHRANGNYFQAKLALDSYRGTWVQNQFFDTPFAKSNGLELNSRGVDIVGPNGINYEILSGTFTNIKTHAERMQNTLYRLITF